MKKEEFYVYLSRIADDIHLSEGARGMKRVLVALHRKGRMSTRDMSRATKLAPPIVSLILERLSADGLLHRGKDGAGYTEKGMKFVENELGIASLDAIPCGCCGGTGVEIDVLNRHSRLHAEITNFMTTRPDHDVTLDQAKCTVETALRRLLFLHSWHVFDGNEVLFLGDDDFMSIASCLPVFHEEFFIFDGETAKPTFHATMMDIDERIVERVERIKEEENMSNLDTMLHDVRDPLPIECRDKFDVVFTDPPYTLNGCKLFLSRAVDALKKEKGTRIFLSFGHVALPVLKTIQELIIDSGFMIEEIKPAFNMYEGGNIIGNISQMMVITTTGSITPAIPSDAKFTEKIYTDD
ncbi:MAG: bis-aminopropyl spermidine synthase family protein [Candidatus Hodarchaeota archaeon]